MLWKLKTDADFEIIGKSKIGRETEIPWGKNKSFLYISLKWEIKYLDAVY